MNTLAKRERNIIMLELLIYMMIGIFYTVYKLKELKRYEIILVSVLWPLDFLLNFIKLVDSVKNRNRQL
ncbi:hypothetical protein J2S19_001681 [Metabacillus malikii]|uniref:Uncharacterized protein n=2 Tax=Metabacillus malikii TaxID=1504265 RepID=A0ABT9ZDT0_9BACI|nr:hypothetical protein [Metabacillus malikii]